MSKFTEQLKQLKIYNSYDYAGKGQVYISYTCSGGGLGKVRVWQVIRPGFKTDPEASWYDYGCKTFVVFGKVDKQEKLEEAIKWATLKYEINVWIKSPYGDWMDKEFVQKRNKELKAQLKELSKEKV
jgi:hypothetical protein